VYYSIFQRKPSYIASSAYIVTTHGIHQEFEKTWNENVIALIQVIQQHGPILELIIAFNQINKPFPECEFRL